MKQQIIISGIGGQGVLFITRILAEAALEKGIDVLSSETHGMAMRGGSVISHVKVGSFKSPIVRQGNADVGLFLHSVNFPVHGRFMKSQGVSIVNSDYSGEYLYLDATGLARETGALVVTNLVLLGFASQKGVLFCEAVFLEDIIKKVSHPRHLELNLAGFKKGRENAGGVI